MSCYLLSLFSLALFARSVTFFSTPCFTLCVLHSASSDFCSTCDMRRATFFVLCTTFDFGALRPLLFILRSLLCSLRTRSLVHSLPPPPLHRVVILSYPIFIIPLFYCIYVLVFLCPFSSVPITFVSSLSQLCRTLAHWSLLSPGSAL